MNADTARIRFTTRTLSLSVGAVVLAFSLAMVAGWHTGRFPARMPLGLERIQYDTAWALAFAAGALIALELRARGLAGALAVVPIGLGALRLVAYAAPESIPVRPMIALPWLPYGAGGYNDMGVLTALILVALGAALATVRSSTREPLRSVLAVLIAGVALGLALLLLFAALTGGTAALRWLALTGGDRTTALLAMLVGGAILADPLFGGREERHAVRRWAPAIVWFAVSVCVLVLWRALSLNEAAAIHGGTRLVAASIRGELERDLNGRIAAIGRLGALAGTKPRTPESWALDARLAIRDVDRFEPVSWIDERFVVRMNAPPEPVDLLGLDVRTDRALSPAVAAAVASRRPTLTRFIDFTPGGYRFIVFVPFFDGDALRGLATATIDGSSWIASLLGDRYPGYRIELDEQGSRIESVAGDASPAGAEWAAEQPIRVANADWTLRVTPTLDELAKHDSRLPEAALALGSVLATLLALCIYLFQTAQRRARDLARANARLVADIEARKRAEVAQRDSEERTRLVLAAIKDHAIYMLDADGRIVAWNPGAARLTGHAADDVLGRDFASLYPPESAARAMHALELAERRGWSEDECWHLRRDGSRYRGDDMVSAIRDDAGALRGFAVVTRDATQRIELREQTERARDFYLSLFSDFPNLVWRCDARGACDYVNGAWTEYTGRPREAELADGWKDGIHPDDREACESAFARALRDRTPFELELRLRRRDGQWGSLICSGRPYRDMEGGFSGLLCSCFDNTERRRAESALEESRRRYEAMTSNVPGMVFQLVQRAEGGYRFDYVSHDCEALTGVPEPGLIEDAGAFFALVPAAERPRLHATLDASAAQRSTWNWSGRLQPAHEPTEKWVTIRARPRVTDDGAILWDGVVLDDTANRLIQLEIERSREEHAALSRHLQSVREEEKAAIARELHDELGSTLTALKMDLDALLAGLPAGAQGTRTQAGVMAGLIDAAVATTRRIVTDLRPSILDDLGLAVALRWQAGEYAKRSGMQIVVDTPEPDLAVDRECALALFRIFQETLTNVMRHASASAVDVRLAEVDSNYVLQIHDNGVGMADEALRKPSSHGIRGMRERARQHGGDVAVMSAPGEGTTVVVTVPRP